MQVVLASNNAGKLKEFRQLFEGMEIEVIPQAKFNVPEAEETGKTFLENAMLKAKNACAHTGLPAIADDSGLEVDALDGAPGIYSARYAGEHATPAACIEKLIHELKEIPKEKRTACFHCALVYLKDENDSSPIIAEGTCEGSILFEPTGAGGFGYDPIFFVPSENCSMAELPKDRKNKISHRGKAMKKLSEKMK